MRKKVLWQPKNVITKEPNEEWEFAGFRKIFYSSSDLPFHTGFKIWHVKDRHDIGVKLAFFLIFLIFKKMGVQLHADEKAWLSERLSYLMKDFDFSVFCGQKPFYLLVWKTKLPYEGFWPIKTIVSFFVLFLCLKD